MSDPRDDGALAALLRLAGPGPEPSAQATARARATTHSAWRQAVSDRRRRRFRHVGGALLAAGLAAIALRPSRLAAPRPPGSPSLVVATVERALARATLPVGHVLIAGAWLDTGAGRLAVRTGLGASLRLDTRTRLRWLSATHVSLVAGALYFDSGASGGGFVVETPHGRVTDEGTLFEARLLDDARLRLRVREGHVLLGTALAEAGEELRVAGERIERAGIALAGPEWEWAETLAVAPAIDSRPLTGFLEWAARERGLALQFADEATRVRAERVRLRGTVKDLTPAEALDAVTLTTGFRVRVDGERLAVDGAR